ncbi:envelope integrity protein Cei [Actinokineospora diospyrosa]|uniref:LytR cell envelope-related transcriptional attenuator n=1 Tax=Actinokineospora diospyrosa TaxID=103728 RepID=A0ABT1I4V0_9PSEU|nr:envelope integrity protein Cei [Actinokineospora diospyrosa]MCP2267635.1 LytR cell envelope-related transcriptional attenuator [Actinokineospora diospyrosa]
MSTGGLRAQRYRRRRPLPAVVLMAVLGLVAGIVWLRVIQTDGAVTTAQACDPPPAVVPVEGQPLPTLGQQLPVDALDRTPPSPAAGGLVRVVNASGQNRLAGAVTEALRDLGFTQIGEPGNDALYPNGSLSCRAQIRFGQQGMGVARTLSLVDPCAELVRDERQDATVDLALGKKFDHLQPTASARRVLDVLAEWAQANPGTEGGLQNDGSTAAPIDQALLDSARSEGC